jgi:hypothetical protein
MGAGFSSIVEEHMTGLLPHERHHCKFTPFLPLVIWADPMSNPLLASPAQKKILDCGLTGCPKEVFWGCDLSYHMRGTASKNPL